jgi:Fic family protein
VKAVTTTAWPAIASEDRPWVSRLDAGHLDVWQRHRLERPYRAATLPPISGLTPDLPDKLLRLCEEVASEIARFDAEVAALPVAMPAVLLRTESASSSQIEHLTSNARNLAIATLGVDAKQNAALVAANVRAMTQALDSGDDVTSDGILRVHDVLLRHHDPEIAGTWRTEQVWVGSSALSPHGADFVPPHHDRVPQAIDDLVAFAARDDLPAVVHAALVHAQFETIHPFVDGNGRVGRVLLHTVLRAHGLTRHTTVPVSAGLLADPEAYFRALTTYRAGDPSAVVRQVADAALAALANGRSLAADVTRLRDEWSGRVRARSDSTAWALADLLVGQPVVHPEFVAGRLHVTDRAARNAIAVLERAGILGPTTAARRNRLWQAAEVLETMDEFARRAGRRRAG